MSLYSVVLFVHVAAVLALFACLTFEALSLFRLRRASALSEARVWIEPVPGLPLWTATSALLVFLSGIYLAKRMSAFGQAWIEVAIAAILLIAPLGALTGKRMRAIHQACASANDINPELFNRVQDPFLKTSLGVRISVFLAVVLLMAAKPQLWESIGTVATFVVLGFLCSIVFWRRAGPLSATTTNLGN